MLDNFLITSCVWGPTLYEFSNFTPFFRFLITLKHVLNLMSLIALILQICMNFLQHIPNKIITMSALVMFSLTSNYLTQH